MIMAGEDKKKPEVEEPEVPQFMVTMGPGFFDGQQLHAPGTVINWYVPDGWEEIHEKTGAKHWAHHDPSLTFRALNKAAEELLAAAKKRAAALK